MYAVSCKESLGSSASVCCPDKRVLVTCWTACQPYLVEGEMIRQIVAVCVYLVLPLFAHTATGATIEFDSRLSVACHDATPEELKSSTERRVAEANIRLSANISGLDEEIESLAYQIEFPEGLEVVDFLPKTELGAEIASPVLVQEQSKSGTFRITAEGGVTSARYTAQVHASASGKASSITAEFLPPKQVVLSAGTRSRGRKLVFELRPSSQTTLRGEKEFAVLFMAPPKWSGSCVKVRCSGRVKGEGAETAQYMKVGMYFEGDSHAKGAVEKEAGEFDRNKPESEIPLQTADCEGEWKWRYNDQEILITLQGDGTCFVVGVSPSGSAGFFANWTGNSRGTWSARDGRLTIEITTAGRSAFSDGEIQQPFKKTLLKDAVIKRFSKSTILFDEDAPLRRVTPKESGLKAEVSPE